MGQNASEVFWDEERQIFATRHVIEYENPYDDASSEHVVKVSVIRPYLDEKPIYQQTLKLKFGIGGYSGIFFKNENSTFMRDFSDSLNYNSNQNVFSAVAGEPIEFRLGYLNATKDYLPAPEIKIKNGS